MTKQRQVIGFKFPTATTSAVIVPVSCLAFTNRIKMIRKSSVATSPSSSITHAFLYVNDVDVPIYPISASYDTNPSVGPQLKNYPFGDKGIVVNMDYELYTAATNSTLQTANNKVDVKLKSLSNFQAQQMPSILSITSVASPVITFVGIPTIIDQNTQQTRPLSIGDIIQVSGTYAAEQNKSHLYNGLYKVTAYDSVNTPYQITTVRVDGMSIVNSTPPYINYLNAEAQLVLVGTQSQSQSTGMVVNHFVISQNNAVNFLEFGTALLPYLANAEYDFVVEEVTT